MNYSEALEYIHSNFWQGSKPGLERTKTLLDLMGNPQDSLRFIHVAGTNGKGSCSHTIAAILQSTGLKVGLFTSPHLVDFRERIRVNGEMVSEKFGFSKEYCFFN